MFINLGNFILRIRCLILNNYKLLLVVFFGFNICSFKNFFKNSDIDAFEIIAVYQNILPNVQMQNQTKLKAFALTIIAPVFTVVLLLELDESMN